MYENMKVRVHFIENDVLPSLKIRRYMYSLFLIIVKNAKNR